MMSEVTSEKDTFDHITDLIAVVREFLAADAEALDANGNIYGSGSVGGVFSNGAAYKLTHSNGGWNYSTLGSFDFQGASGGFPQGAPVVDAQRNLYGVCQGGPFPSPDAGTCGGHAVACSLELLS